MKLTIAIPVMNQLEDTKGQWGCLISNTTSKQDIELLVINNGSTDGTAEFLEKYVFPYFPDHRIINNPENVGVLASMQQCYQESKGDVIAILHNDLYIFDFGWNEDVMKEFESDEHLGLAGFLGAEGIGPTGGRMNTHSNMLEAEVHGFRTTGVKRVVVFDGMSLICRRAMLDAIGGFDLEYTYHHFYDRDISIASIAAGWHNKVIGIFCHHRSGVTANRPDYQKWIAQKLNTEEGKGDLASYLASEQRFIHKWKGFLPRWQP